MTLAADMRKRFPQPIQPEIQPGIQYDSEAEETDHVNNFHIENISQNQEVNINAYKRAEAQFDEQI